MASNMKLPYWNNDMNVQHDLKELVLWITFYAIVTPLIQRAILWPTAKRLIKQRSVIVDTQSDESKRVIGKNLERKSVHELKQRNLNVDHIESRRDSTSAANHHELIEHKLQSKQRKFVVAATKCISYLGFVLLGFWSVQDQQFWFWSPETYHIPFATIPWRIRKFYILETAYYLYTMVAMFFEPKMKDRAQMLCHHIFTLTLLVSSFVLNTTKYGTTIMMLHDFSDPWMEAAKLANYLKFTTIANSLFMVFATSFVLLRVYVFPRYLISAVYIYTRKGYPFFKATFWSLVGLWVLHIIWTFMIWRVFYENAIKRSGKGDVREEDD